MHASLFPDMPAAQPPIHRLPRGFSYRPGFLTRDEEAALLSLLGTLDLRPAQYREYNARRMTGSYSLRRDDGAPEPLRALAAKVERACNLARGSFPHALVTFYPAGAPMGWHRDAPPCREIYGVSLGGDAVLRLRPHIALPGGAASGYGSGARAGDSANLVSVTAERRSLYVMSGESRSRWQHSIPPVPRARWSITLRTL